MFLYPWEWPLPTKEDHFCQFSGNKLHTLYAKISKNSSIRSLLFNMIPFPFRPYKKNILKVNDCMYFLLYLCSLSNCHDCGFMQPLCFQGKVKIRKLSYKIPYRFNNNYKSYNICLINKYLYTHSNFKGWLSYNLQCCIIFTSLMHKYWRNCRYYCKRFHKSSPKGRDKNGISYKVVCL